MPVIIAITTNKLAKAPMLIPCHKAVEIEPAITVTKKNMVSSVLFMSAYQFRVFSLAAPTGA